MAGIRGSTTLCGEKLPEQNADHIGGGVVYLAISAKAFNSQQIVADRHEGQFRRTIGLDAGQTNVGDQGIAQALAADGGRGEIGRASCRERV